MIRAKIKSDLTSRVLRKMLCYNPCTGLFTYRISRGHIFAGQIAGTKDITGRGAIKINYRLYKTSRLAWLYCYGVWPSKCIDHIDKDPSNDSIWNLRDISFKENVQWSLH